jgi:hypothetical protein
MRRIGLIAIYGPARGVRGAGSGRVRDRDFGATQPRPGIVCLSGIVAPGTRVFWVLYKANRSPFLGNAPFRRFGTTFARSNCVIDQRDVPFPAATSVYVSCVRREDNVVVLNQLYGKVFPV